MMNVDNSEKISIIVPVYNLELYIERTLQSIINQTYTNIEIVIVDDGSTDRSWEIIQNIVRNHNHIIAIHQENGGVTSARLHGVENSSGEWIGFVDGDDEVEADMFEHLLNNATTYNADISHCGYQMIFPDGRIHYFYNTEKLIEQDRIAGIKELLSGEMVEPGLCNKLYKRELFKEILCNNLIPLDIKINEDLLMNFYLFNSSEKLIFEDKCRYHYLVRGESASRQQMNKHKIYDPIRVKEIILNVADDNLRKYVQKAYLNTCIYTYTSILERRYTVERKKIQGKIQKNIAWTRHLSVRSRLMAGMIVWLPGIFGILYKIYEKGIQKKKYN